MGKKKYEDQLIDFAGIFVDSGAELVNVAAHFLPHLPVFGAIVLYPMDKVRHFQL